MDIQLIKSSKKNILEGLLMLEPNLIRDNRGFFFESWNEYKFNNIINEKNSKGEYSYEWCHHFTSSSKQFII